MGHKRYVGAQDEREVHVMGSHGSALNINHDYDVTTLKEEPTMHWRKLRLPSMRLYH